MYVDSHVWAHVYPDTNVCVWIYKPEVYVILFARSLSSLQIGADSKNMSSWSVCPVGFVLTSYACGISGGPHKWLAFTELLAIQTPVPTPSW